MNITRPKTALPHDAVQYDITFRLKAASAEDAIKRMKKIVTDSSLLTLTKLYKSCKPVVTESVGNA